ncbi:hypothetical protein KZZ52_33905 [Dactylosporangium sp. AC04546]|uniref:hypothetical protein n=1 Tax=Dactylosporangium sp. AC04546 TaxID=2862460 RepID=UPI001EDFEDDE|nr:hypothetical protein [Dactylosporangium sp. AC04546]WVK78968.1 hypothetical protein KZZ52_33905 [Dactylosporangium sp. AC04546]
MLYLLLPSLEMKWNNLPESLVEEVVNEHDVDLGRLSWEASEHAGDDGTVRLAVRRGIPCSTGIVLLGSDMSRLDHPNEIRHTHSEAAEAQTRIAGTQEIMKPVFPGPRPPTRERDARIDGQSRQDLGDAEADAEALLASEPSEALLSHWAKLEGPAPSA